MIVRLDVSDKLYYSLLRLYKRTWDEEEGIAFAEFLEDALQVYLDDAEAQDNGDQSS